MINEFEDDFWKTSGTDNPALDQSYITLSYYGLENTSKWNCVAYLYVFGFVFFCFMVLALKYIRFGSN